MLDQKIIRRVLLLGTLGIISILAIQVYLLKENYRIQQSEWDQEIRIALLNVAKHLADFNESDLPRRDLVRRVSPRYYVVNINDEIDANVLELYLFQEMERISIQDDFEYAIYDCGTDAMVYGDYCSIKEGRLGVERAEDLPRYKDFTYYFGVRFPDQDVLWYGNQNLMYLLGAILGLAMFLFAYCFYIIIRQQRLAAMQRDFISNITHEFKTPLTSIRIAADAIADHPTLKDEDRMKRYAQIIRNQSDHLHDQVIRVLGLSKLEQGEQVLQKEDVDLIGCTRNIIQDIKMSDPDVQITVGTEIDSAPILADPFHLRSVISNLIDNAIKYNKAPKNIHVKIATESKGYIWTIQDNGIGMTKEEREMAMEKYYRASDGDVHDVKGFGLGLYYVSQIVHAHHWSCKIKSKQEEGTTITITIPKP